ncbi:MAG: T9SS type A sorting domain-containing protein [Chitinophagales bacterium]|nr:T9SS type A sorting domain-containing protein [Chitinophagales bacterium]
MKNLRLLFLISFIGINSSTVAQQEFKEWAPIGANWLYCDQTIGGEYFCVRIAHERDTTVRNHRYKVFDVFDLQVRPTFENRSEVLLGSYFISTVGDTVFEYCRKEKKEVYYVDRELVGDTIYPYRSCDPNDTVWVRLDTVYYKIMNGFGTSAKYKMKIYSSNASYFSWGKYVSKDTLAEFMPYKAITFSYLIRSNNFNYHKYLVHNATCRCNNPNFNQPRVSPQHFDCYYDPNLGSYIFYSGFCWLRNAYMSIQGSDRPGLKIYPNPAKDQLFVQSDNSEELLYIIYDSQGKYISSDKFHQSASLDISHLPPSTYYICIQNKSEVLGRQKFVKN